METHAAVRPSPGAVTLGTGFVQTTRVLFFLGLSPDDRLVACAIAFAENFKLLESQIVSEAHRLSSRSSIQMEKSSYQL